MDELTAARASAAAGLATPAGRAVLLFGCVGGVANGATLGHFASGSALFLVGYLLSVLGALALTVKPPGPLSLGATVGVTACGWGMTVVAVLTVGEAQPFWLAYFGAILLALLFPRGNPRAAVGGWVLQFALVIGWGIASGQDGGDVVAMLGIPTTIYLVALVWRIVLARHVDRERAHRSAAADDERRARASMAAGAAYRAELAVVRRDVEGVLSRLRDGERLEDGFRADIVAIEGRVRDRLRSPELQDPALVQAFERARRRGVHVTVLAEPPGEHRVLSAASVDRLSALIDAVDDGAIVLSSLADSAGGIAVVVRRGGTITRTDIVGAWAIAPDHQEPMRSVQRPTTAV